MTKTRALDQLQQHADVPARVAELYRRRAVAIQKAFDSGATVAELAAAARVGRKVIYDALTEKGATEGRTDGIAAHNRGSGRAHGR